MSENHLPSRARKILSSLIRVVKPKKPGFDPAIEDFMLDFLDDFYAFFPWHLKLGFPLGLYLLEYGAVVMKGPSPFTSMKPEKQEEYVRDWINSSVPVKRDLIKGVKGVCLTAYYSHPEVMKHIGYDLEEHLERVNRGEPCDQEACDYFREMGYDRNSAIPYPAYDNVEVIPHDAVSEEEAQ